VSLDRVRDRYLVVNGDHPMSPADDAYVLEHFAEVPDGNDLSRERVHELMAEGRLPLPSYLLSDGTPMVHPDYLDLMRLVGSIDGLHDWFVGQWPDDEREVAEEEWAAYLSGRYVCLWTVTPRTIKAKTDAIEDIKARVAELEAGEGSRDRLREAVARLDEFEPPFTAYDALRFGGRSSREVWIEDVSMAYLSE
jgi:hypothetical protein